MSKLTTDFFKNYIATTLANDPDFDEIMNAYRVEPEFSSLRNPKKWKRVFKKQGTISELAKLAETTDGDVFFQLNEFAYDVVVKTHGNGEQGLKNMTLST